MGEHEYTALLGDRAPNHMPARMRYEENDRDLLLMSATGPCLHSWRTRLTGEEMYGNRAYTCCVCGAKRREYSGD